MWYFKVLHSSKRILSTKGRTKWKRKRRNWNKEKRKYKKYSEFEENWFFSKF